MLLFEIYIRAKEICQNEKIAAFFLVPNAYTNAWLMNNPTVIPIVTAIIAAPISIPLPLALIPPAWDKPD